MDKYLIDRTIAKLDQELYIHFFPDEKETATLAPEGSAAIYLKEDLGAILTQAKEDGNYEEAYNYILCEIRKTMCNNEIMEALDPVGHTGLKLIGREAEIRSDFDTALKNCKTGTELSYPLHFGFREEDIKKLAQLHKSGKYREKIEDLLQDCNFHTECSDFSSGLYEKYI